MKKWQEKNRPRVRASQRRWLEKRKALLKRGQELEQTSGSAPAEVETPAVFSTLENLIK